MSEAKTKAVQAEAKQEAKTVAKAQETKDMTVHYLQSKWYS